MEKEVIGVIIFFVSAIVLSGMGYLLLQSIAQGRDLNNLANAIRKDTDMAVSKVERDLSEFKLTALREFSTNSDLKAVEDRIKSSIDDLRDDVKEIVSSVKALNTSVSRSH